MLSALKNICLTRIINQPQTSIMNMNFGWNKILLFFSELMQLSHPKCCRELWVSSLLMRSGKDWRSFTLFSPGLEFCSWSSSFKPLRKEVCLLLNTSIKCRVFSYALEAIGQPVTEYDLCNQILNGLGPEYDSVHTAIANRNSPITFERIYLVNYLHFNWGYN